MPRAIFVLSFVGFFSVVAARPSIAAVSKGNGLSACLLGRESATWNDPASIFTATHWPSRVDSPRIIAAKHPSISRRAGFCESEQPEPGGGQRGLLPKRKPAEILRWSEWCRERNRRAAVSRRKRRLAVLHRRGVKSRAREPALYDLCHSGMSLSWPVTRLLTAAACTVD